MLGYEFIQKVFTEVKVLGRPLKFFYTKPGTPYLYGWLVFGLCSGIFSCWTRFGPLNGSEGTFFMLQHAKASYRVLWLI